MERIKKGIVCPCPEEAGSYVRPEGRAIAVLFWPYAAESYSTTKTALPTFRKLTKLLTVLVKAAYFITYLKPAYNILPNVGPHTMDASK